MSSAACKAVLERAAQRLERWLPTRRFARNKDGAVAIEFAVVAAPFVLLLFAILETAIIFFASQTLETAVADSARLIMTGQAQTQSFDATAFKNSVCSRIFALFDCQNGMYVDVRSYTSFAAADMTPPLDAKKNLVKTFQFNPGSAGDIVVVRIMYEWPVYVSLLSLGNMSTGNRLLMATAAFRNEPYK